MADRELVLDLRGVACPMNFVKAKLFLDKLEEGSIVDVLVDAGEPVDSVTQSLKADGHEIVKSVAGGQGYFCLSIRKCRRQSS